MVILAVLLAVAITYFVWIRRPEQRLIKLLFAEMKLSAAIVKPGDTLDMEVTVLNDKVTAVPILRVDINLPDELAFADGDDSLPRHRTHMCTLEGKESITFTHKIMAMREGKVALESPELIVYSLTGAVIDNNSGERGKTAARLRIRTAGEEE